MPPSPRPHKFDLRKTDGHDLPENPWLHPPTGKVLHNYLGMNLDFSEMVNIKVSMIKYVGKILIAFPEELKSTSATPAAYHMFKVRDQEEVKLFPEEQAKLFHHFVAQLLFLCS